MIRSLLPRLLGCAILVALVVGAFALPALSRPAAEVEKPLGKVSPDLALVPRDALWFVSIRAAVVSGHPALKALKELPDIAFMLRILETNTAVPLDGVERFTLFMRRMNGGPVVIVRTLKPYDKDKVLQALHLRDEVKAHGKSIYASGRYGPALWLVDNKTYVFGGADAVVPYLAAIEKPAKTHPLAEELKEADGTHSLTAAFLPRDLVRAAAAEEILMRKHYEKRRYYDEKKVPREFPKDGPKDKIGARGERFVSYQKERPRFDPADFKEEPLKLQTLEEVTSSDETFAGREGVIFLSVLRSRKALLTVDLAPKAAQLKASARLEYSAEADAKDGETAMQMARLIGREAATLTPSRRKAFPAAALAVEPVRLGLRDAKVKRDGKAVTLSLEVKPDPAALFKAAIQIFAGERAMPPREAPKDRDRPKGDERKKE